MYKIVENLLTKEQENILENCVLNENTQWIFNRFAAYKSSAYGISDEVKRNISSFRHVVFQNGIMYDQSMFDAFKIIPQKLGANKIYNMICQLQLVTSSTSKPIKHVDMPLHLTPYKSAVYYINKSDGPTVIYNHDNSELVRCEHEQGKVIMFNGDLYHHASRPTKDIRCIMNFCFD